VNIQNTDFSSILLNRDTWSNPQLKELIKTEFVLWQAYSDTETYYCSFYEIHDYPHISIIHPLTGELLICWEGLQSPEDLRTNLTIFLDQCPLEPDITRGETGTAKENSKKDSNTKSKFIGKAITEWPEEEQLNLAIEMSMRENQTYSPDIEEHSNQDEYDDYDNDNPPETIEKNTKKRTISELSSTESVKRSKKEPEPTTKPQPREEPSNDIELDIFQFTQNIYKENFKDISVTDNPDCTLQLRLPNGKTLKAGFLASTPLKSVLHHALVRGNLNVKGKSYSLVTIFPRRQYSVKELCTLTLKDTDLIPRAVLVLEENFVT